MGNFTRSTILFVVTISLIFVPSCGNQGTADQTASVTFQLVFPESAPSGEAESAVSPLAYALTTGDIIEACLVVDGDTDNPYCAEFSFEDHTGTINGVPVGTAELEIRGFEVEPMTGGRVTRLFQRQTDLNLVPGTNNLGLIEVPTVSGKIYFFSDPTATGPNLYSYDSINSVMQITNTSIYYYAHFVVFGGEIYISWTDYASSGDALKFDGITVTPDSTLSQYNPWEMVVYDGELFFSGADPNNPDNRQLYSYNLQSVTKHSDIAGMMGGGLNPMQFTVWNGDLYFIGTDDTDNIQLCSYNSTDGQTYITAYPQYLQTNDFPPVPFNGKLYFGVRGSDSYSLWAYDGEGVLSSVSTNNAPTHPIGVFNETLFLSAEPEFLTARLWEMNKSEVLNTFNEIISPLNLTVYGDNMYFTAQTAGGPGGGVDALMWTHDKQGQYTSWWPVTYPGGGAPIWLTLYNEELFFTSGYPDFKLYSFTDPSLGAGLVSNTAPNVGLGSGDRTYKPILYNPLAPPVADFSGTWTVVRTGGGSCAGDISWEWYLNQWGSSLTIQDQDDWIYDTDVLYDTVQYSHSNTYFDGDGTATRIRVFDLQFNATGDVFTGYQHVYERNGLGEECTTTADLSGLRI